MFEQDLFARLPAGAVEIHSDILSKESQTGESHALCSFLVGRLDCRGIFNNFGRITQRLLGIPKLESFKLSCPFHRNKWRGLVSDAKDASYRLSFGGMACPSSDRSMNADNRNIHF